MHAVQFGARCHSRRHVSAALGPEQSARARTSLPFSVLLPFQGSQRLLLLSPSADETADVGVQECEGLSHEGSHIASPEHEYRHPKGGVDHRSNLAPVGFRRNVSISLNKERIKVDEDDHRLFSMRVC